MIGIILLIVWLVISTLLITSFSVEWGRALVYMLAEGFGHDAVRVNQTVDLDPIIKQFPYVLSPSCEIDIKRESVHTMKLFGENPRQ